MIGLRSYPPDMQGSDTPTQDDHEQVSAIESRLSRLEARITAIEGRLEQIAQSQLNEQQQLRRLVDMKVARTGELSSRIAQRIAKLETAVDLLSRCENPEAADRR